jgi:hypothetical protein
MVEINCQTSTMATLEKSNANDYDYSKPSKNFARLIALWKTTGPELLELAFPTRNCFNWVAFS